MTQTTLKTVQHNAVKAIGDADWHNISDLLRHWAEQDPQRHFLTFVYQSDTDGATSRQQRFSYRQFDDRVNQACHLLRDAGIAHGDVVNLHLTNCPEFLILWFAIARIGAVMMPTNVLCAVDELGYLLDHSGSTLSFTSARFQEPVSRCMSGATSLQAVIRCDAGDDGASPEHLDAMLDRYPITPVLSDTAASDLASIMYTSGTTSRPKGVLVTHMNYLFAGTTVARHLSLTNSDRQFIVLPMFHGNAQYYSAMSALLRGASIALMDRFSAGQFFDQCIEHRCTIASLFAAPLRMILAQPARPEHRQNSLRAVLYAQNISDRQRTDWAARFGAPLRQLWGMTETMGPPLMTPVEGDSPPTTIGVPVGGYQVELVDENQQRVGPGHTGQIRVGGQKGRSLMAGYLNDLDATDSAFRDGWLYSGDNAVMDDDGYFYFVDRAKDMIKRSGENVSAAEVEIVVMDCPGVFECAVVGLPDPVRDESIVAVVVAESGATVEPLDVINHCVGRLASFRVPEKVVVWDSLPRTPVGKIQKHLVRTELLTDRAVRDTNSS